MAVNPFANSVFDKSRVKSQAVLKINARLDTIEDLKRVKKLARSPFPGTMLGESERREINSLNNGDIAYVMRSEADHGAGARFTTSGARNLGTNSTQVPILAALNGLEGTPEEMEAKIQPIGLVEMGNRDNFEISVNVIVHGSMTRQNTGKKEIRYGDWLRARVPSPDELKQENTSSNPAERHGSDGRVTLLIEPDDPFMFDIAKEELQRLKKYEAPQTAAGKKFQTYLPNPNPNPNPNPDGQPNPTVSFYDMMERYWYYRKDRVRMIVGRALFPAKPGDTLDVYVRSCGA